ncbi:N-acetyltransferase family protein [Citreimonas sp.]|uniref:N-acetyltransferase family protein n=1 Tax=Citreimonas sp. TaxID=3036715 RepID=UPI00405A260A
MEAVLRSYRPDDHAWLLALHVTHYARSDGFDDSFVAVVDGALSAFEAGHDPARERGFVAEADRPLGSIFCVREDDTTARLRMFILRDAARGTGLGRRMLGACTDFARAAGYRRMVLGTHESHRAACALYQRAGWRCVASHPVHSFGVDLVEQRWETDL